MRSVISRVSGWSWLAVVGLVVGIGCKADDPDTDGVDTDPVDDRCDWAPVQTWDTDDRTARYDRIAGFFEDERAQIGAEGVAWAVLVDGEIRFAGADGMADDDREMQPTTLMRSGSTLKMQTAAMALTQVDAGVLSLDDRISDVLPDFSMAVQPGVAEEATLHQLLSHQGGFYDYTPIDGPSGDNALYNHAHNVFASSYYMLAPPGSFYNYSNPNFSMAGLMAQEAAGVPYAELMDEALWTPLCMDRSFLDGDAVRDDGDFARATTTDWETGIGTVRVGPRSYHHGFAAPAGFAWTSVLDQLHFAKLLLEGHPDVLPADSAAQLTAEQVDLREGPPGRAFYGYGVAMVPGYQDGIQYRDARLWQHSGAIPGYAANLMVLPDHGVAVAVLSNTDGATFTGAMLDTLNELVDLPTGTAPDPGIDVADFDTYAGTYDDPFNVGRFEIGVDAEAEVLTLSAPDLDALSIPYGDTLTPVSEGNFILEVQGFQLLLSFLDDDSDGAGAESHWARTRIFVLEREDPISAQRAPAPALDLSPDDRRERIERALATLPRVVGPLTVR